MNDTYTKNFTTADLAALALGNDGQNYRYMGILPEDGWRVIGSMGERVFEFDDGSAIYDSCGGGWDVGFKCPEHGWCWASIPCPSCESS